MFILLIIFIISPVFLFSHDIEYKISQSSCYVIDINYVNGTKLKYEQYEIYKPREKEKPHQVGRTNEEGRIYFIPDEAGKWQIKVFTEDGHGINFSIEEKVGQKVKIKEKDFFERFAKPIFGVGIILMIFSIINLFTRKKNVS